MRPEEQNRLLVQLPEQYYEGMLDTTSHGYQALTWRNNGESVSDLTEIDFDTSKWGEHVLQVYNVIVTNTDLTSDAYFSLVSYDPSGPVISGDEITPKMLVKASDAFGFVAHHPFVTGAFGEFIGVHVYSSENVNLHVYATARLTPRK